MLTRVPCERLVHRKEGEGRMLRDNQRSTLEAAATAGAERSGGENGAQRARSSRFELLAQPCRFSPAAGPAAALLAPDPLVPATRALLEDP